VAFYRNHASRVRSVRESIRRRKLMILQRLGWEAKCVRCGYDRYIGALDFHHTDHTQKEMSVNRGSIDSAVQEAAKCTLLCANCHREAHQHDTAKSGRRRKSLTALPHLEAYLRATDLSDEQIQAALRVR
jgi:5-methylcytosine-specific restriction endonuclease McrA